MAAPGERSLATLLATLAPALDPTTYAYAALPPGAPVPAAAQAAALMQFREPHRRAWTLVLPLDAARAAFAGDDAVTDTLWACRLITLDVHSSLEGVGFMAAVAKALADARVACNPVAGWWSDHLFVGEGQAGEALAVLARLRDEATAETDGRITRE